LLDQRVEVKGIRIEVLSEAHRLGDRLRVDLELVGEVGPDQREDLLPIHPFDTVAVGPDGVGSAARSDGLPLVRSDGVGSSPSWPRGGRSAPTAPRACRVFPITS